MCTSRRAPAVSTVDAAVARFTAPNNSEQEREMESSFGIRGYLRR